MIQIDIDMPKQCGECPLCVDYDCIIHKRVTDEYYDTLEEQHAHCPLTMPSAQPEIIRCKDCKYAYNHWHCKYAAWWNDSDDFCSNAERREDVQ